MRQQDVEDLKALNDIHNATAMKVVEQIINPIHIAGGSISDVLILLESVASGILIYVNNSVPDFDIEKAIDVLTQNILARVKNVGVFEDE